MATVADCSPRLPRRLPSGPLAEALARWLGRPARWFSLRRIVAIACWVGVATLGFLANGALDWPALRWQVAVMTGSFACSLLIAERWGAEPEQFARGTALAILGGAAAGLVSLA